MIYTDKIIIKNYKCFNSDGAGFEKILPINLIVGKNNSGKSTLIELVRFLVERSNPILSNYRDNLKTEIIIEHNLGLNEIAQSFSSTTRSTGIPANNLFDYGKLFVDKKYRYRITEKSGNEFIDLNADFVENAIPFFRDLVNVFEIPLYRKIFCNISAERDIFPEDSNANFNFLPNGGGATNTIQQIINRSHLDSSLIEKKLLTELNKIINPDIKLKRIFVQQNGDNKWEIFFEDSEEKVIALSKMGSGIKTILLTLLNLIVKPANDNNSKSNYVFAFEELENNLHPSLQRRLYNYIKEYCEEHHSYFFLTTHSNVAIDTFGGYHDCQIIHVVNDGNKSSCYSLSSSIEFKEVLTDLGIKASDILQSNGIIWVEGPSDRNYINKWISILAPELKEGIHYSIMFYGGRLLANLTFDFDQFDKAVIPLLKINRNAFVVIDRDGNSLNGRLNQTKTRISNEIGEENSWITKGREIENYLSNQTVMDWLNNKFGLITNFSNDENTKLENNIVNSGKNIVIKYGLNKTKYSSEIIDFIGIESLDVLDLKSNIINLISKIKDWNK